EVRQAVGLRVPLPRNVLVAHATEVLRDRTHLGVQPLERWVLDAVAARQLLDQQTAVGAEEHVGGSELLGLAEPLERRGVLRDVVGRDADTPGELLHDRAVRVGDRDAVARGPRGSAYSSGTPSPMPAAAASRASRGSASFLESSSSSVAPSALVRSSAFRAAVTSVSAVAIRGSSSSRRSMRSSTSSSSRPRR